MAEKADVLEEQPVSEKEIYEVEITEKIVDTGDSSDLVKWSILFGGVVMIGIAIGLLAKRKRNL